MNKKVYLLLALSFLLTSCQKKIVKITSDEIDSKIDNNESFIYYAGSKSCYNCSILNKNIKKSKNVTFYYLDIEDFSTEDKENLRLLVTSKLPESYYKENGLNSYKYALYTPAIFKYVKGNLVSCLNTSLSKDEIKDFYEFNLIDIYYYENFESMVENEEHFKIIFYDYNNQENISFLESLKEILNDEDDIEYCIKYSNLTNSQKDDLLVRYNQIYSLNLEELPSKVELVY